MADKHIMQWKLVENESKKKIRKVREKQERMCFQSSNTFCRGAQQNWNQTAEQKSAESLIYGCLRDFTIWLDKKLLGISVHLTQNPEHAILLKEALCC